ncbi:acyl-CoA-binding domain-containing protein 4 [Archocentrus centrarchus]|uniref:acyl-CoA-binding domain-containing protein 4 n=1 Tax=Archocentrus centrarchus TaxID=63155 RepID=UPI0011E9E377|nr:acyl-CoA-binding domain-containing protein 4-like [Archocentrus centrarchus]
MGRLSFYVLWSLRDAPRQFISKSDRRHFQVHIPLPLPKQLVIFGLGQWEYNETTISVEVLVSADVPAQKIGTLSPEVRCLTWEGDWSAEIVAVAAERGRRGVYGKILLTVSGEPHENSSVFSSTPLVQRKCLFPEGHDVTDPSTTLHQSTENETITSEMSHLGDSMCFAEIQVNKVDTSDSAVENKPPVWPTEKTPRRTVISRRGQLRWSSEDVDSLSEDIDQASTPKKRRMNSQEEMTVLIKNENRGVSACPSKRWCHTVCLSDPDTAILIGGETSEQKYCKDSLWKLELDSDFWFPMNSSDSGPEPPCARGHSATYDPDSKAVFVYGGLREGQRYTELYILNTLTWKWKLVNAKGNVPNLAYHSAAFYKKELFVFGGVQSSHSSGDKSCSNALYIFNPEFELWYQPIVEGDRPLPRFGHTATLLSQKLIIFGGRKTAAYFNDLHVLDLGFMEYTAVKSGNMPPLPRGFHAALPVSDNKILVSGGCSAIGVLQDVHVFNTDTNMWSSLACPLLCSKPRAGHSMILLGSTMLRDTETPGQGKNVKIQCALLVFGGSDCSGSFYNDTVKCTVEIPVDE